MEAALEAGGEDVVVEAEHVVVYTTPSAFLTVKEALDKAGLESVVAETTMIPSSLVAISDVDTAKKVLRLYEKLEDHDDVQNVYSNFDIPEDVMSQAQEG